MSLRPAAMAVALCCLVLLLAMGSCKPNTPEGPGTEPADSAGCAQLDTLMQSLQKFEALAADASWAEMQPALDDLTARLRVNMDARNDTCSFFNLKLYPDVDRFGFIELLKIRITEDSIVQGILYLIKLRGAFCVDKEITEFMSEEMAHVAVDNPTVFLRYYNDNPGQQELLLHSTRWHNVNIDSLVSRFNRLQGGEPIASYLLEWRQRRMAIPDR
jgi:hypothetical protein